ncbi:MAG: hypothetical protein WC539_03555 [Nitrospirota bacterium]
MTTKKTSADDSDLYDLIDRLKDRAFDPSYCFLCANHFDKVHLTAEHVIPQWAQRRFDLWNQQLVLLNGTSLLYRQITVPCCEECNKYRLQPIETTVSSAVSRGVDAVRAVGRNTLFLWLGKIFYGILYRELSLLLDRSSSDGLTIATPKMLHSLETHLLFLQAAREKVEMVNFTPGSIYIFRCQALKNFRLQWDFCDNIDTMFIAIRMGEVGIIGILGDGGAQMIYESAYRPLEQLPLHPIQFRELCAHFSYRATLATRTPKLVAISGAPHQIYQNPLGGFSMKPYFDEWVEKDYAQLLANYTGCPFEIAYLPPDQVKTWLHDRDGNLLYLDFETNPIMPR